MIAIRARAGLAVVAAAVATLAACTSSGDGDDEPSTTPSGRGTTVSPSPSPSPAGFASIDGAYVVAGPAEGDADVYRVVRGQLRRVTTGAHVTTVTDDGDGTVVVGREQRGAELVQRLRSGRPTGIGIGSGFAPALSDDGALAWVSLDGPGSTPGVTKPRGFTVHVRSSPTGRDRALATFPTSVGGVVWTDAGVVVAVASGDRARLVRLPTTGGAPRTVAVVADAGDLDVTAGDSAFTVSSGDGYVLVSASGQQSFPTGWRPLCWSDDDEVLATRGGRLGTVTVDNGRAGTPRVLGTLPAGTSAYGGSCADV